VTLKLVQKICTIACKHLTVNLMRAGVWGGRTRQKHGLSDKIASNAQF